MPGIVPRIVCRFAPLYFRAFIELLLVLSNAAHAAADVAVVIDYFNRAQELDHLEAQFGFEPRTQRSAVLKRQRAPLSS